MMITHLLFRRPSLTILIFTVVTGLSAQPTSPNGIKFKFHDYVNGDSLTRPLNHYHFEGTHFYHANKLEGSNGKIKYEITNPLAESSFDKESCKTYFFHTCYDREKGQLQITKKQGGQIDTMLLTFINMGGKTGSIDIPFKKGSHIIDMLYLFTEEHRLWPMLWGSDVLSMTGILNKKASPFYPVDYKIEEHMGTRSKGNYMVYNFLGELIEKGTLEGDRQTGERRHYFNERGDCGLLKSIGTYEKGFLHGQLIEFYSHDELNYSYDYVVKQISLYHYDQIQAMAFFDMNGKLINMMGEKSLKKNIIKIKNRYKPTE